MRDTPIMQLWAAAIHWWTHAPLEQILLWIVGILVVVLVLYLIWDDTGFPNKY